MEFFNNVKVLKDEVWKRKQFKFELIILKQEEMKHVDHPKFDNMTIENLATSEQLSIRTDVDEEDPVFEKVTIEKSAQAKRQKMKKNSNTV